MTTLEDCLATAAEYWEEVTPDSARIQEIRATICVEILGRDKAVGKIGTREAQKLLQALNNRGLARKSVQDYYSTFKRMVTLGGKLPEDFARWPRAITPPRKTREGITAGDFSRMVGWLADEGYGATRDLAIILASTGVRVQREALQEGNLRVRLRDGCFLVHVAGKGGHERWVPIVSREATDILRDKHRTMAMRAVPYKTHLDRWNTGRLSLGIKGLTTFHSIRHKYATEVLGKTNNLRLVQDLLGHSNPATTAIYAHVSMDAKVKALTE